MQLLALDFDGVISDSAPECFVVALCPYFRPQNGTSLARPPGFDADSAPAPAAVEAAEFYRPFVELMPLGNRAEDFGIVLSAIDAGATIRDQGDYDRFRAKLSERWLDDFHTAFYEERRAVSERDPVGWERLMEPYPGFLEMLRGRASDAVLAIATAKDRRSVDRLLGSYGARDLFPVERVFDKETGVSKVTHLRALRDQEGVAFAEMTFVDDKVNHLDSVASLGVRCALAAWGYNGDREITLARERGYLVCALDDVEPLLFG